MPTNNNLAERVALIQRDLKLAQLVSQERMSVDTETVAALIAHVEQLEREAEQVRKRLSDLLTETVYENSDKTNGIAVKFLMRLNLLAYKAKLEGYSMDNPFIAEAVKALSESETETCPVCKDEVPADSMYSYNHVPNAFCQGCVDSGRV